MIYSYNSFRLKDEEIADMIEGAVLYHCPCHLVTSTVRRNATWVAARFRHYIFATTKLWYARRRAVYI